MRQTNLKSIFAALLFCLPLAARADVTLAWNPAVGSIVTNYTVFWGTNTGVYTFDALVGTQTNLDVTGLLPGTVYYFSVQASDTNGVESAFSNEIIYTNPAIVLPPPPPPPVTGGSTNTNTTSLAGGGGGGGGGGSGSGSGSGGGGAGSSGSSSSEYPVPGIPPALTLAFSNGAPLLNIAATVGATLSIQSSTNPMDPDSWTTITDLPITNALAGGSGSSGAPSTIGLAFAPALQSYQVIDTNPPPGEFYRTVMPYDYMVLADSVLSGQGYPSRLLMVVMPGTPAADVCYVTPQSSFLYYDATNAAFALEPSAATIREIAGSLSKSLGQNWTTASEFAYSNGVSSILATVVETEPPSSDPVAGTSSASIVIDF